LNFFFLWRQGSSSFYHKGFDGCGKCQQKTEFPRERRENCRSLFRKVIGVEAPLAPRIDYVELFVWRETLAIVAIATVGCEFIASRFAVVLRCTLLFDLTNTPGWDGEG